MCVTLKLATCSGGNTVPPGDTVVGTRRREIGNNWPREREIFHERGKPRVGDGDGEDTTGPGA